MRVCVRRCDGCIGVMGAWALGMYEHGVCVHEILGAHICVYDAWILGCGCVVVMGAWGFVEVCVWVYRCMSVLSRECFQVRQRREDGCGHGGRGRGCVGDRAQGSV